MFKLGFIGTGNMGSAIIRGIVTGGIRVDLYAYEIDPDKISALSEYGVKPCNSEQELAALCDFILIAVKPQVIDGVLEKIAPEITEKKVIISIAAGISASYIQQKTVKDTKVVQVMPNTPMMLGVGATAIARTTFVEESEFSFAKSLFECCGIAIEVPLSKMNEIIAINGSSPAFIYLYAKGFVDYARSVGISGDNALKLFCQSLIGSAKMLSESGMTIDELIKQVSSPGGTTLAGLDKLYEGNLTEVVGECCKACTNRAYELAKRD